MSKRLATINTAVPIEFDFESMRFEEPDTDRLVELYKRLEFNSFLKKMKGKKETDAGTRKERKQEEREQP